MVKKCQIESFYILIDAQKNSNNSKNTNFFGNFGDISLNDYFFIL